ncbi:MAG: PAS-domain containing protein [Pseudomonadota bacterium]
MSFLVRLFRRAVGLSEEVAPHDTLGSAASFTIAFDLDTVSTAYGDPTALDLPPGVILTLAGQPWTEVPGLLGDVEERLEPKLSRLLRDGRAFQTYARSAAGQLLRFNGSVSGLNTQLKISIASAGEESLNAELDRIADLEAERDLLTAQRDTSPVAVFEMDATGSLSPMNPAARSMVSTTAASNALSWLFPSATDGPQQLRSADGTALGWVRLTQSSTPDNRKFVHIEDIDQQIRVERALESFMSTLTETFAHLDSALAIFDRNRQLTLFNPALTSLFDLNPANLAARPSFREFLEALRSRRMLPEQSDFTAWRRSLTEAVERTGDTPYQDDWTLPSGQILRVTVRPHPRGALAFVFKDISGHVMLERRYRAEIELGQATLDRLHEAVAVFGSSGQILFTNSALERALGFNAFDSLMSAGIEDLVRAADQKCNPGEGWQGLIDYVLKTDRQDRWNALVEPVSGGRWLLRASALPDGSTMLVISASLAESHEPEQIPLHLTPPTDVLPAIAHSVQSARSVTS